MTTPTDISEEAKYQELSTSIQDLIAERAA